MRSTWWMWCPFVLGVGSLLGGLMMPAFAYEEYRRVPQLPASQNFAAVLLQDAETGQVLFAKNSRKIWPQASLTKMMLGLVVLEEIEKGNVTLRTPVKISRRASRTRGRTIGLRSGEVFPLEELLQTVLVTSANDAAVAVAEHVCGSVSKCVQHMNDRAQELGMKRAQYRTVNGMPTKRNSAPDMAPAEDIAILARELLRHPHVLTWTSQQSMPFRNGRQRLPNTNRLVGRTNGVDGLKTGFTRKARFNLVTTAQRSSVRLIAIVFGGKTSTIRFRIAKDLLEWGFTNFTRLQLIEGGAPLWVEIRVENGSMSAVQPVAAAMAAPLVRKDEIAAVSVALQIPSQVSAPVLLHQVLGEIVVRRGKQTLAVISALSPKDIPQARWTHARR